VYEVIASYPPGGAEAYLTEMRGLVGRCPKITYTPKPGAEDNHESRLYAIVAERFAGDDAVMISKIYSADFGLGPLKETGYFVLLRFGDIVITIDADGWHPESVDRAHLDRLVSAAVSRAAALKP
jgi:hypothetical protein